MNKRKYLIKLFPADNFFFGGEHTFGQGNKANYFARSNLYPQQSALLGMLRYQILKKKNLLGPDAGQMQVNACIGPESFKLYNKDGLNRLVKDFSFGRIKALSPLFLLDTSTKQETLYFPMPLDYGYEISFPHDQPIRLHLGNKKKIAATGTNPIRPSGLSDRNTGGNHTFDHKTYANYARWLGAGADRPVKKTDDIWLSSTQIGITKTESGRSDKDNFYKQTVFKLQKDFCFAFYTVLEEESGEQLLDKKSFVFLGGQRSVFLMETEEVAAPVVDKEPENSVSRELLEAYPPVKEEKIVLASDAYIENLPELMQLCRFAWSDSTVFRNIETSVGSNKNYYAKPKKSAGYVFLKRGSVLYVPTDNMGKATGLLDNEYLKLAGYNLYIKPNQSSK